MLCSTSTSPLAALGVLIALLAPATAAAPLAGADDDVLALHFHIGGKMDTTPGDRPGADPTTVFFSWDGATVMYTYGNVPDAFTLRAADGVRLVLHRDPVREADYSTRVILSLRVDGAATTLLDETVGPVRVAPPAPAVDASALDPRDGPAGAIWPAALEADVSGLAGLAAAPCAYLGVLCSGDGTPGNPGGRVPSILRLAARVAAAQWEAAGAALDDATAPGDADGGLVAGWNDITLSLASDVEVPAGASLEVRIITLYEGSPVSEAGAELPEPVRRRFDFTAVNRPEIVNRHDSPEFPSRLELALVTA